MAWETSLGIVDQKDPKLPKRYMLPPLPLVAPEPEGKTLSVKTAHTSDTGFEDIKMDQT